jgi:hypothetical protein
VGSVIVRRRCTGSRSAESSGPFGPEEFRLGLVIAGEDNKDAAAASQQEFWSYGQRQRPAEGAMGSANIIVT